MSGWGQTLIHTHGCSSLSLKGAPRTECTLYFISPDPTTRRLHCRGGFTCPIGEVGRVQSVTWATSSSVCSPPYLWGECCLFSSPPLKLSGKRRWEHQANPPSSFLSSPNRWRNPRQVWVLICWILWGLFVPGPTFKAQIQISKVKWGFRDPPGFTRKSSTLK